MGIAKIELIRRSLMWLAGTALPATPLLQERLHSAIRAIIFAVMGAVILSCLVVALLIGAYGYIVSRDLLSEPAAFAIVAGIALLGGGSLLFLALRSINGAALIKDDLALFGGSQPLDPLRQLAEQLPIIKPFREAGSSVRDVASAFMDGLMNGRPSEPHAEAIRRAEMALAAEEERQAERLAFKTPVKSQRSFL